MLKYLCILASVLTLATPAFAQEFGGLLGVHQTTADTDAANTTVDGKLGFKAGVLIGFELVEKLKFRSGLLYNQRHIETKTGGTTAEFNFAYLDIPANVQFNINEMFGLFGGLTFAVNVNDDVKLSTGGTAGDPDADKMIPLLDLGVNLMFQDMIGFDFYYQRGLGGFADSLENHSTFGGNFIYWF